MTPINPMVPWPRSITNTQHPVRREWMAYAVWRHYGAGGYSRWRPLAMAKALWNVTVYRLFNRDGRHWRVWWR